MRAVKDVRSLDCPPERHTITNLSLSEKGSRSSIFLSSFNTIIVQAFTILLKSSSVLHLLLPVDMHHHTLRLVHDPIHYLTLVLLSLSIFKTISKELDVENFSHSSTKCAARQRGAVCEESLLAHGTDRCPGYHPIQKRPWQVDQHPEGCGWCRGSSGVHLQARPPAEPSPPRPSDSSRR